MPEECPTCFLIYSNKFSLNRHIQRHHQQEMTERIGRLQVRDDEPGVRKKSKSRERGDISTDSLYAELTDDAYYRMLEDGADSKTIYSGQPPQVQTALQNRFLEERMEYQREKAKFEQLMREHSKLEAVFAPILFGSTTTTTTETVPTSTTTTTTASSSFSIFGSR